jgi:fibronectin-binding autotransporter adhesin
VQLGEAAENMKIFGPILLICLCCASLNPLTAATFYWTGKGGSNADSWTTSNNWGSTFNVAGNAGLSGSTSADNLVVDGNNTKLQFAGTTNDNFGPTANFNTLSIVSSATNIMAVSIGSTFSLNINSTAATGNLGNGLPGNEILGNLTVNTGGTLSFNAGGNPATLSATVSTNGGTATLQGSWTASGASAAITNTSGTMTLTGITLTGASATQTLLSGQAMSVTGTNTFTNVQNSNTLNFASGSTTTLSSTENITSTGSYTLVSGATLNGAGTLAVASGGTLTGAGAITGTVALTNNGTVTVGGTTTVSQWQFSTLTQSSTGKLAFDAANTGTYSTSNDRIDLSNGTSSTVTGEIDITLGSALLGSGVTDVNTKIVLIRSLLGDGLIGGNFSSIVFTNSPTITAGTLLNYHWVLTHGVLSGDADDFYLSLAAPEPASVFLLLGALAGFAVVRRRTAARR